MKSVFFVGMFATMLVGCQTFLGTNDRCTQAAVLHAGFVTVVQTSDKVPAQAVKGEKALYAGINEACQSGSDLKSVTFIQLVNSYVAFVTKWKE